MDIQQRRQFNLPTIRELFKQKFENDKFDGIAGTLQDIAEAETRVKKAVQDSDWNWVTHYSKHLEKLQEYLDCQKKSLRTSLMILQEIEEED